MPDPQAPPGAETQELIERAERVLALGFTHVTPSLVRDLLSALRAQIEEGWETPAIDPRALVSALRKVLSPELMMLVEAECRRGLAAQYAPPGDPA